MTKLKVQKVTKKYFQDYTLCTCTFSDHDKNICQVTVGHTRYLLSQVRIMELWKAGYYKVFQNGGVQQTDILVFFSRVQIIFHFLWNHWAHCCIFEKEDVSSVANFITAYEESQ